MNIIFMGTPEFALPAFNKIINSGSHNVVAAFTQEPKATGRGLKITNSPIHILADKHSIPVYTPKTLSSTESAKLIESIEADIIVVIAYGFIIPGNIINIKKFGSINIHPSRLPKYRGAAPLQRIIIDGCTETSVCIIQMDEGLDTGDIILQEDFTIEKNITLPILHDRCAETGADMLLRVLDNITDLPRKPQSETGVMYAHKLSKKESRLNWNESAFIIDCKIRGMTPWPGVYFMHGDREIKIIEANYQDIKHSYEPGQLINDNFEVGCGSGILRIKTIKPSGKKEMPATDYLRGIQKKDKEFILFS